ncbi:MAG: hypothetical protein CMN03_13665 [Roseibacillus sp.]|nr:hypothetical protein [Roseibacillus sp.]
MNPSLPDPLITRLRSPVPPALPLSNPFFQKPSESNPLDSILLPCDFNFQAIHPTRMLGASN